jgi:AbrB family looped-hinge helix DNA binding protein
MTRKGQITVPKAYRDSLGLDEGDVLYLDLEGNRVVISKPGIPLAGKPIGIEAYRELIKELGKVRSAWR